MMTSSTAAIHCRFRAVVARAIAKPERIYELPELSRAFARERGGENNPYDRTGRAEHPDGINRDIVTIDSTAKGNARPYALRRLEGQRPEFPAPRRQR